MAKQTETIPAEWDDVAAALKGQVDNPYAVVNSMVAKGYQRKGKEGKAYNPSALHKRYIFECGQQESVNLSALGQLARKGVKPTPSAKVQESAKLHCGNLTFFSPFREAVHTDGKVGKPQVVLISAGPGNKADGNFYPPDVIQRDAKVFDGIKTFLNHPGVFDEQNRPEREVEIIGGWFSNVQAVQREGNIAVVAELNYMQLTDGALTESGEKTRGLCEAAVVYQRQYPDSVLLGFSINAEGPSHAESSEMLVQKYPQFAGALAARNEWSCVDGIESAVSVDVVSFPARGGKVLGLTEAQAFMESERWRASFRHVLGKSA